jgi:hypothetical protein
MTDTELQKVVAAIRAAHPAQLSEDAVVALVHQIAGQPAPAAKQQRRKNVFV